MADSCIYKNRLFLEGFAVAEKSADSYFMEDARLQHTYKQEDCVYCGHISLSFVLSCVERDAATYLQALTALLLVWRVYLYR